MTAADVLAAAADRIEHLPEHVTSREFRHGAGSHVFCTLLGEAERMYGTTAILALERHLHVGQVQHWRETDPTAVVAALRSAAKEPADPGDEVTAVRRQLADFHTALGEALGWGPWSSPVSTDVLVGEVVERMGRMEKRIEKLTADLDATRTATRTHECHPTTTPAGVAA